MWFRNIALLASLSLFPFALSLAQIGISTEELPVQLTRPDASLKFRSLDVSTGMPDDFAGAMIQDSRGFIWTATFSGIVRYDGYDMKVYGHDPENEWSIPDEIVVELLEDSDGYIWVGLIGDGGLARFDPRTERFERFPTDSLDQASVTAGTAGAIFEDSRGDIWVGTSDGEDDTAGGLNRFDPATNTFQRFMHDPDDPNSISVSSVLSIAEDLAGNLWVGTLGGGVNRFNRDTGDFVAYRNDPDDETSLSHDEVWEIHVDSKGIVRLGV